MIDYKQKFLIFGLFCFLITIVGHSTETRIYSGFWKSKTDGVNIELKFKDDDTVDVKINKKTIKNVKCEFVQGKSAAFPFLYVNWIDKNVGNGYLFHEHALYLIIGTNGKFVGVEDLKIMKGFYEFSKARSKDYNEEFRLYPIDLIRSNDVVARH